MPTKLSSNSSSLHLDWKTSILGLVIFLLFCKLFSRSKNKELLLKLPGPKAYPLVGNIADALASRVELFRLLLERAKKYGSIYVMWLGTRPIVWVSDPAYIEKVLHGSSHLEKSLSYKFVASFLGTGLITATRTKWMKQRKLLTPTFHFYILDSFFGIFTENAKTLINLLDKKADSGKVFDIFSYVNNYAMDNICEAAMGVKVESQTEKGSEYARTSQRLTEMIVYRVNRAWLAPDFIYRLTSHGKEFRKLRAKAYEFVDNVIEEKKKILLEEKTLSEDNKLADVDDFGKKKRLAFLDSLLENAEKETVNLSIEDIRDEVNTFMLAGHDTTTTAIVWTSYLIGIHPKIQEELYREQRDIFGYDMETPIKQADLPKMELLDRVMKESLRLFPSVPVIGRVLDEDVKFGEYIVPQGTTVNVDIFGLHRNPSLYPEPNKFDPDRFLPENISERHSFAYVPFSAGPRNCLGKRFAVMEAKLTLALLIRRYEIKSMSKMEDITLIRDLILRCYDGTLITLTKRVHE